MGQLVDKVRFKLNKSFGKENNDINVVTKAEITYSGWGVLTIPVTIYFKKELKLPKSELTILHSVSFDGPGAWKQIGMHVPKIALQNLKPVK